MTTALRYSLGVQAFEARRFDSAIEHFEAVLADVPTDSNVREYLARSYYHRAALSKAESLAREILESDPTNEYVVMLLARTLDRQGRQDEATAVRRRLLTLAG